MVPKTWVKFVVGVFFLPLIWVLTKTFGEAFWTSLHEGLLASQGCLFFLGGILFWVLAFWLVPRSWLFLPYVYGHECTHAIWVKIFGGNVQEKFHVSMEGGHIIADRVNTWIALAPYFFPIYSALVLSIYGVAKLFTDVSSFHWILFLLLGFTWGFHLTFTCMLVTQGQPDLHYSGTFFSLIVIYAINLLIVTVLLLAAAPHTTVKGFAEQFLLNMGQFIEIMSNLLGTGAEGLEKIWQMWQKKTA